MDEDEEFWTSIERIIGRRARGEISSTQALDEINELHTSRPPEDV